MKDIYPIRIEVGSRRVVFLEGLGYFIVPIGITISTSNHKNLFVAARGTGIPHATFRIHNLTANEWLNAIYEAAKHVAKHRELKSFVTPKLSELPVGIYPMKEGKAMLLITSKTLGRHCKVYNSVEEAESKREEVYAEILKNSEMSVENILSIYPTLEELEASLDKTSIAA